MEVNYLKLTTNLISELSWINVDDVSFIKWSEIKKYLSSCSWYIIVVWDEVKSHNGVLLNIPDDILFNDLNYGEKYLLYGILSGTIN